MEVAKRQGIDIKIAIVAGDDIMGRLDDMIARGVELKKLGHWRAALRRPSASAKCERLLRCLAVVDALARGAQIVITGRVTDTVSRSRR
jgi:hypothetical protein